MAYEFLVLEAEREGVPAGAYIVCGRCRALLKRQPNVSDWAAYDSPFRGTQPHPTERDAYGPALDPDPVALCSDCYLREFKKRYPEDEAPTTLWDGRFKVAKKVAKAW